MTARQEGRKERNILEGAHPVGNNLEPDRSGRFIIVSEIWMDLLFDMTAGKTVIFLAIFTHENCPDLTCCKIIFFYSKFRNEGNFSTLFYSYYLHTVNDDACINYC
jgi:hypothetical protein